MTPGTCGRTCIFFLNSCRNTTFSLRLSLFPLPPLTVFFCITSLSQDNIGWAQLGLEASVLTIAPPPLSLFKPQVHHIKLFHRTTIRASQMRQQCKLVTLEQMKTKVLKLSKTKSQQTEGRACKATKPNITH